MTKQKQMTDKELDQVSGGVEVTTIVCAKPTMLDKSSTKFSAVRGYKLAWQNNLDKSSTKFTPVADAICIDGALNHQFF